MHAKGISSSLCRRYEVKALTINDDNGCSEVFDFTITQPDELQFSQLGYEPAYCRLFDYQNGNGVVYVAAVGGTGNFIYEWYDIQNEQYSNNSTWGNGVT